MAKRRFVDVATSSDDDVEEVARPPRHQAKKPEMVLQEPGEGGAGEGGEDECGVGGREAEEEEADDARPIGKVVMVSGKRKSMRKHYKSFEYKGELFELGDTALFNPSVEEEKPYAAIIKDITQDADDRMMVNGQWFYRPHEAKRRDGGNWPALDNRELFYSFHFDEVPAESVKHKCVVHFVPLHKQLPVCWEHPGFIVQKVYDHVEKELWKISDKDYKDDMQHEIDMLLQKTQQRLKLPDIESGHVSACKGDQLKSNSNLLKEKALPVDVLRGDPYTKSGQPKKAEKSGSYASDELLGKFKALTGEAYRDKWLEKLLHGLQQVCKTNKYEPTGDKQNSVALFSTHKTPGNDVGVAAMGSKDKGSNAGKIWSPDAIIPAVVELEMVTYEALGTDFQKYNQKMRQLDFNLKSNPLLARRLLNKELEPLAILTMSAQELKDGLTADERITDEPEKSKPMQMTDARCSRCMEKKVGVASIIKTVGLGDRYQLECLACGHEWYASQDAIVCFD